MRIVHVTNFNYKRSGHAFANCDHKFHLGLCQNGHYVYPFPFNDIARQLHWARSKNSGKKKANQSLLETCRHVQPDLLLLAHAQHVGNATLEALRAEHPALKIAQWYVDALEFSHKTEFLSKRLPYLDHIFASTGGELLEKFQTSTCAAHYLPNPVHPDLERGRAFAEPKHDYDLLFIGTDGDGKDVQRGDFLRATQAALPSHIRFGIFGSLGQPRADGPERDRLLSRCKAALNLTRYQPRKYYSSDRIAQIMGNGVLACSERAFSLHEIYGEDALLSYQSPEDLAQQLTTFLDSGEWKTRAEKGWEINHQEFSVGKVTDEMLRKTFP